MQANVEVAATTGNRINAAPAPRTAAIGATAGITGTSVAKASAAPVPNGDNFPTSPSIPKSIWPRGGKKPRKDPVPRGSTGPEPRKIAEISTP